MSEVSQQLQQLLIASKSTDNGPPAAPTFSPMNGGRVSDNERAERRGRWERTEKRREEQTEGLRGGQMSFRKLSL